MSQIDRIIALLEEIRDAVVPPPVVDEPTCPHPEEARISLRTMGGRGEQWQCGLCKFVERSAA